MWKTLLKPEFESVYKEDLRNMTMAILRLSAKKMTSEASQQIRLQYESLYINYV